MAQVLAPTSRRRIVVAEVAGFCFGVRRAVEMLETARKERSGRITTLGPIIHNEQVISRMRDSGVDTAPTLTEIAEGTVVLSAHGVSPDVIAEAKFKRLDILDVTCPFVTKVHRTAKQLYEQGYQMLIVGDPGHTEVKGVVGAIEALGGTITRVASAAEVRALTIEKKVGIVCQTTQRNEDFAAIVAEVSKRAQEVRAINTICGATDELQEAAVRMAHQVQVALVIGGKNSANTRRLCQICREEGIPAYHIETPEEIDENWLEGKETIGITAGASTPDWLIEAVARKINFGVLPEDWNLHHPDE